MRSIKFRGKRVDNGEWVYGDFVHNAFNGSKLFPAGIKPDRCFPVEVIPETVGQFIGRHDKAGKEIFEKDILCFTGLSKHHQRPFVIARNDSEARFTYYSPKDQAEIIGNVFDNPDLIERTA